LGKAEGAFRRQQVIPRRGRRREIGVIQNVEKLRPELHGEPLAGLHGLVQTQIELVESGDSQDVTSDIAVSARGRDSESGRIGETKRRRGRRLKCLRLMSLGLSPRIGGS